MRLCSNPAFTKNIYRRSRRPFGIGQALILSREAGTNSRNCWKQTLSRAQRWKRANALTLYQPQKKDGGNFRMAAMIQALQQAGRSFHSPFPSWAIE